MITARFNGYLSPPPNGEVEKSRSDFWGRGRPFAALLLMLFALFFVRPADAAPVKILAFGTSLTQGYGVPPGDDFTAVLEARLKAAGIDAKLINAGVSGDTSADGLSRLDWSLADHPDAAIIEMGSNDALRGLAPAQTEKNLSAILAKLTTARIPVLLVGMKAPRNFGPEYAAQFDPIYPRLAKKFDTLFYPFILDGVALNPRLNQADGIHPNPAGVKIIVGRILPLAKQLAAQARDRKS
jgi:acyl-CoA thioesterase I